MSAGLNMGNVGVGSDNSQGRYDNVAVQELPPQSTFANTQTYDNGTAPLFTGTPSGTWAVAGGRYGGAASSTAAAVNVLKPGVTVTPDAYTELETLITPSGVGGLVFDYYADDDFKYVTLDPSTGTLSIGHHKNKNWVTDFSTAVTVLAGVDQRLEITLRGLTVNVLLNGVQLATYSFNGDVVDGGLGLLARTGSSSFDNTRFLVGTQVVNAVDAIPPTLTVPANVVRSTDPGKATTVVSDSSIGTATATDNVPGVTVSRSGVPAGNVFPIGVTTITWTARDVFDNVTVKTQTVTVNDLEKPVLIVPASLSFTIAASQSSLLVTDAQLGTATATDNSGTVTLTRTGVPAGNIFPLGTTTITYKAVDPSGNTTTLTQTVTVVYPAIVLTAPANQTSVEGSNTTFNLGSLSGGGGSWTASVNWGDGATSTFATAPGSLSAAHTYVNDRTTPYTVQVTITDASGASRTSSFTVAVTNAAPTVTITSPVSGSAVKPKTTFTLKASFADPGVLDTHTCSVTWGDGGSSTGTVAETSGAGTCTATHSYAANGTYTITVKVTDNGGASKSVTSTMYVTTSGTAPAGLSPLSLTAPSPSVLTRLATPAKTAVPHQHAVKTHRPVAHRARVSRIRF